MTELTYDPHLNYKCKRFGLIHLHTNDTLILVNNTFVIAKEEAIKTIKFMTKEQACLLPKIPIKFNGT